MRVFKVKQFTRRTLQTPVARLAAAALTLCLGTTWSLAQEGTPAADPGATLTPQVHADWQVVCEVDQPCRMSQTVAQPATARAILQARVFKGDDPTLLISFPLGILLSPGWRYRIDGRADTVLPFEICDAAGCHAGLKLTRDLIAALKRSNEMQITFYDAARTPVNPVLSLAGFTKAWEALP
jgi:invasion protein IalB